MIVIILAAGLILRLISLNQSLWLDEAINVNVAQNLDFISLITKYSLGDFHPPLYHLILKTWIGFFGSSEIIVRIPSVMLGVGTIYTTYLIAKNLFEKKTALIAATLIATAPLHIYYSQEARMYMLAAFSASLSVYFFIKIIKFDSLFGWFGFIVSTAIMLYTDYLPYLLLPTYIIYLVLNRKRISKNTLISFLPAFIIIFLATLPWFMLFPQQLKNGLLTASNSPAWAKVVGAPHISSLILTFVKFTIGRISVDNNLTYWILFMPIGLFSTLLLILSLFRMTFIRAFLWFWLLLPVALAFLTAFFVPVFSYFRLIFVLPALYILWASAINTINWPRLIRILLLFALIVNLTATVIYLKNQKFQRENWRDAAGYVISNSTQNSITLFDADYPAAPFDYYNKNKVEAYGAISNFNAQEREVEEKVKFYTKNKKKVFLFQYLSGITDPNGLVFSRLTDEGFKNIKTIDFTGVGFVYQFERN